MQPTQNPKTILYRLLQNSFNTSELEELCFELDIDFESIKRDSKEATIRELINFTDRRGELTQLIELTKAKRPNGSRIRDPNRKTQDTRTSSLNSTLGQPKPFIKLIVNSKLFNKISLKLLQLFLVSLAVDGIVLLLAIIFTRRAITGAAEAVFVFAIIIALFICPSIQSYWAATHLFKDNTRINQILSTLAGGVAFAIVVAIGNLIGYIPNEGSNVFFALLVSCITALPGTIIRAEVLKANT